MNKNNLTRAALKEILKNTTIELNTILGSSYSKNTKDCAISKAVGALEAVYSMLFIGDEGEDKGV